MSNTFEQRLKEMHSKFGISYDGIPRRLDQAEKDFRVACLFEEIEEFAESDGLVDQYDALIDLAVFLFGTAERMGMSLEEGFEAVMKANMAKEVGNNPNKKDPRRAGFSVDLVKPDGWKGPEDSLTQILVKQTLEKAEA